MNVLIRHIKDMKTHEQEAISYKNVISVGLKEEGGSLCLSIIKSIDEIYCYPIQEVAEFSARDEHERIKYISKH